VTRRELIKNKSGSILQESSFKDTTINDNTVDEDHLKLEKEKLRKKKATKNALRRAHRGDPSNFNDFNNDPLSKIYKYYTGDDMEEFEEDLFYENLAALSEEEFTTKESAKKREGKQRKVHQDADQIKQKVAKMSHALELLSKHLKTNVEQVSS